MSSISGFLGPVRQADLALDPDYLPSGPNVAGQPRQFRAIDMPAATAAHAALHAALAARESRFTMVYCSTCGDGFGPGEEGFSLCSQHAGFEAMDDTAEWAVTHRAAIGVRT